jgi:NADH-quinone oxidoreductase subunit G
MIKHHGEWHETDWKTALEFAASHLKQIADENPHDIGVLVSPNSTMEEAHLAKKLAQGLGTGNLDYRLRHSDFRLDGRRMGVIWMGCNIPDIQEMDRVLVVGSNLRNEHPLLAQRLRRAVANGAELSLVNPLDDDPLMNVANKAICTPNDMVNVLSQILKAMSGLQRLSLCLPKSLNELLEGVKIWDNSQAMAESLAGLGKEYDLVNPRVGVFLGNLSQHHPRYSEIFSLSEAIASLCGGTFGVLSAAANSVGANLVGVLPADDGLNARTMLESPRKAYVLVNVEPELDCHNAAQAALAMEQAECVVALVSYKPAYKSDTLKNAHVLLPIAPFTETSGTLMSLEGRVQSFKAATKPLGECRPGWKVLRVLGNTLGLEGFEFDSSEQVKDEIFGGVKPSKVVWNRLNNNLRELGDIRVKIKADDILQRVGEIPQYQSDSVVRRSPPLQKSKYTAKTVAGMHSEQLVKLGLQDGDQVLVKQDGGSATLTARADNRVPVGCVRVAAANTLTAGLGDLMGVITVEKVAVLDTVQTAGQAA